MADVKVIEGLKYTPKHEWIKVEGDVATYGITDYAQKALGDIVFLQLPDVGSKVKQGDSFGTIESVKAADDLYAAIGGEVVEVNSQLVNDPSKINKDAYSCWMVKLKGFNPSELNSLMDDKKYKELTLTLD